MPTDLPPAQRRLSLSGASAAGWLGRRGATVPPDPGLRLYADALHDDGFSVARVWSSAETLTLQPRRAPRILLVVDGTAVLADGRRVAAGDTLLVAGAESFVILGSLAWIEVALSERSPLDARFDLRSSTLVTGTGYREILAAACHALLAGSATPSDDAWPAVRRAVEDLVVALLRAGDPWSGASMTSVDLVGRAVRAAEGRAHDPDFSVEELARLVAVSERSLQRAFRSVDSSPRSVIREIRAREALRRLGATTPDRTEAQRVARQAGFRTAEAMRSAIRASALSPSARRAGSDR